MNEQYKTKREQLQRAIEAQEALRPTCGDSVVDITISTLKEQIEQLESQREQRKQVTVLFADVSGFTAISEMRDHEEMKRMMNDLWKQLDPLIKRRNGKIDKHIGDAVMAIFGIPISRENDGRTWLPSS